MIRRILFILTLMSIGMQGAMAAATSTGDASDAQPMIVLDRTQDMIASDDMTPMLRVYRDGQVHVHRPAYLRDSGDYRMQLSAEALSELVATLLSNGVATFDGEQVKQQKAEFAQAQRSQTGTARVVSDATHTLIGVHFVDYPGATLSRTLSWDNLGLDARVHSDITALVQLAQAERLLMDLARHPSLRRVSNAAEAAGASQ